MVLFALDTATGSIGISLHDGSQILAESLWVSSQHHTIELAPEAAIILRRVGASPVSLTGLAVARGPGSYTGLRIGMAFAKGLALAHNLPLVGISTLDILAQFQPRRKEPMLALIKVGRKRMAGLWYKWGRSGWKVQDEVENFSWGELLERLDKKTYICGEIDGERRKALSDLPNVILASPALCVRRPSFLAELAWEKIRSGKVSDAANLRPVYLKPGSEKTA